MEDSLEARDIKKAYKMGKVLVPALRGVSFKAAKGEFIAVLGPSGSGKSTLMQILGALDRPDEGKAFIDGMDLSALNDDELAEVRLRKIGFVFQFFNLLPRFTAFKNVEIPLALADFSDKDSCERAKEVLKLVGLSTRASSAYRAERGGATASRYSSSFSE